ncbi:helix-turn-helix domain-containing protein [Fictibacillus sp. KU28468]|nr:helix-turn-helix domain-containing protein [Fictibacillus sp. KU28468]UZJ81184.1 helix-turn-helix domain containing protein [Fictibacillus sp. KU28468]
METALHFGITNSPMIASWKKAFNEGGAEALGSEYVTKRKLH